MYFLALECSETCVQNKHEGEHWSCSAPWAGEWRRRRCLEIKVQLFVSNEASPQVNVIAVSTQVQGRVEAGIIRNVIFINSLMCQILLHCNITVLWAMSWCFPISSFISYCGFLLQEIRDTLIQSVRLQITSVNPSHYKITQADNWVRPTRNWDCPHNCQQGWISPKTCPITFRCGAHIQELVICECAVSNNRLLLDMSEVLITPPLYGSSISQTIDRTSQKCYRSDWAVVTCWLDWTEGISLTWVIHCLSVAESLALISSGDTGSSERWRLLAA